MSANIPSTNVPIAAFTSWLASGERGLSSEAIVSHLSGHPVGHYRRGILDHPWDPSDFRRCQLLLRAVPLAKLLLPKMRTASPEWARLVDAWDDIHNAIEAEAPGYLDGGKGSAPIAYRLMKRVIAGGVECATCSGTGRGEACEKCKGTGRRGGGRCRAIGCWLGWHHCRACQGRGYAVEEAS